MAIGKIITKQTTPTSSTKASTKTEIVSSVGKNSVKDESTLSTISNTSTIGNNWYGVDSTTAKVETDNEKHLIQVNVNMEGIADEVMHRSVIKLDSNKELDDETFKLLNTYDININLDGYQYSLIERSADGLKYTCTDSQEVKILNITKDKEFIFASAPYADVATVDETLTYVNNILKEC